MNEETQFYLLKGTYIFLKGHVLIEELAHIFIDSFCDSHTLLMLYLLL